MAARLAIFSCQIVDFPASVYLGNFESIQICENGAAKRVFAFINEELLILLALSAFENFILLVDDSQIYFREKRGWYLIRAWGLLIVVVVLIHVIVASLSQNSSSIKRLDAVSTTRWRSVRDHRGIVKGIAKRVVVLVNRGASQTTPSYRILAHFVLALGENASKLIVSFVFVIALIVLNPLGLDLVIVFDARNFLEIHAFDCLQQVEGARLIFISNGLFDFFTITNIIGCLVALGRRFSAKIGKLGTYHLAAQI